MTFEHQLGKRLLSAFEALSEIRAIRLVPHLVEHAILYQMVFFADVYIYIYIPKVLTLKSQNFDFFSQNFDFFLKILTFYLKIVTFFSKF